MVHQLTDMARFLDEEVVPNEADLIARYIGPKSGDEGRAYARLDATGPSVSAIIRSLMGNPSVAATAATWNVPEDAVRAAIGFYRRYRAYVDARILLEDDDWSVRTGWPELLNPRG